MRRWTTYLYNMPSALDFWGPFYPPFWGETCSEAGGSMIVPVWTLFWYRFAAACGTGVMGVLGIVWHKTFAHRLDRWAELCTSASFGLLAICSWQHATGRLKNDRIARIAGPLHHTACSLSLLVLLHFWAQRFSFFTYFQIAVNVVPFALVVGDFMLGATLRFRLTYILFPQIPVAFHGVWLNFAWSGFVLHHIAQFMFRHFVLLVCAIVACAVSRGPAICAARRQTQASSDDTELGTLNAQQEDRGEGYTW